MNWKEFLKPDKRKIVIMIVLNIFFNVIYVSLNQINYNFYNNTDLSVYSNAGLYGPVNIFIDLIKPIGITFSFDCIEGYTKSNPTFCLGFGISQYAISWYLFIDLIVLYLLSCLTVWIYDKFRKKKK